MKSWHDLENLKRSQFKESHSRAKNNKSSKKCIAYSYDLYYCIEASLAISIFDMLMHLLWSYKIVKIRRRCQIQKLRPRCGKQWSLVKSCCFHATGLTLKRAENDIFAWLRDTTNGNEECVCIATLLGRIYPRTLLMFSRERKVSIHKPKDIVMSVVYEFHALTCFNTDPSTLEKTKLIY